VAVAVNQAYQRAVAALGGLEGRGMKLGLERIEALLNALDNPHRGLAGVLVAGTNGKGSVCALVESMARAAGLRTVMMTKPHLVSWTERVAVNGEPIADEAFAELIDRVLAAAARLPAEMTGPTVFEVLTAVGILAACDLRPDVLVTEVGLGGRLDSTNVLDLGVAVVTGIALDHRADLGDDPDGIAAEKAAIIKPGNDVVTAATGSPLAVIRRKAATAGAASFSAVGTDLLFTGQDRAHAGVAIELDQDASAQPHEPALRVATPLIGAFQERNLAVAAQVCLVLRRRGQPIPDEAITTGAATVHWPGRMQWIDGAPALLVDGCHNPDAVAAMVASAFQLCAGRRTVAVFGAMSDKDVTGMLAALRPLTSDVVFTQPASDRALTPAQLATTWAAPSSSAPNVATALTRARDLAGPTGVVVACGSLYIAGEALEAAPALGWGVS
jgi:dihydrofolate synthase/folylpolyglutamate synthase